MTTQQLLTQAVQHHQSGRLAEADALYRQVLAQEPKQPDALHLLGLIAYRGDRAAEAVDLIGRAVEVHPAAEYLQHLADALSAVGRHEEAVAALNRAVAQRPDAVDLQFALGNLHFDLHHFTDAEVAYRRTLALRADHPEALNNLANTLFQLGQFSQAVPLARRAVELQPNYTIAWINLGLALEKLGDFDGAIEAYRRAAATAPQDIKSRTNLGVALQYAGLHQDALAAYDQALAIEPNSITGSCRLILIQLMPGWTAADIKREQARWDESFGSPLRQVIRPHLNDRSPQRQLRIGYVSPDFHEHVVAHNVMPLFDHHDRTRYSIFCYANVAKPDSLTDVLRTKCDGWRDIRGRSDADVEQMIRADRIDILVDLALHTRGNRLLLFARKPAPVQVSFAGYPGSTGLRTIDYRITDPHLEPPGADDALSIEAPLRLPNSFWCFKPTVELPVGPLPVSVNGHVTFGSLNLFAKINDRVLERWAKVLRAVDRSTLSILAPKGSPRSRVAAALAAHGILPQRVHFVDHKPIEKYFEAYNDIDIMLDTLPYNGHSTSLDALWMGVPVVTLVGDTVVGRAGFSQLTNLGLPELICFTDEQFVKTAAGLAGDIVRLAELRRNLRDRMKASPLMDAENFTRGVEAAYRTMWGNWVTP